MKLFFANDLGYGSIKGVINDEEILIPSVTADLREQDMFEPVDFSTDKEQNIYFNDMFKHMDVTVQSPQVRKTNRMLIGEAALDSHLPVKTFDVNDFNGKSQTDHALILTLTAIATKALKQAYINGEDLSEGVQADVFMTTALPVAEGKKKDVIDAYRNRYKKSTHLVTFHNFNELITVKIKFQEVIVSLEGETAKYALSDADKTLAKGIYDDFKRNYSDFAEELDSESLLQLDNKLFIDIGEGTTDFIVFTDDEVNEHSSTSIQQGYGNALEDAIDELTENGFNINNRAALQELILEPARNPMRKQRQKRAKEAVNQQLMRLVDSIVNTTSKTLRKASASIDVIFVLGGGSIPLKDQTDLRAQLVQKTEAFSDGIGIPVVFIPEEYAQHLNENGLKKMLDVIVNAE